MRRRFDQVLVFCPNTTTGGPEALHQLVGSINRQGGTAKLVYTGPQSEYQIKDGVVSCSFDKESIAYKGYQRYSPEVLSSFSVTINSLLIFPEISVDMAWAAHCCLPCTVAVWWLAVHDLGAAHDESWCQAFVQNVVQICQSHYALESLRGRGAATIVPLFDYTDRNFVRRGLINLEGTRPYNKKPRTIAFFPRKGGKLADQFFEKLEGADMTPVAIENMSKDEVMEALCSSEIYIDFGHHPGKDRVPREAAAVGNVILLNKLGAARHHLDHPLDSMYKFDRDDIESGSLRAAVEQILDDAPTHLARQRHYRQKILLERVEFDLQVRQFFFHGL